MAKSIYGVHAGVTMVQTAIAKLPEKTGRSLDEWIGLKLGFSMGKDVRACPCKTIVPLYRRHVVAQIKPTTRTRIDLGLALGRTKAPTRLIATGGLEKGDRITHRIEITAPGDIDGELTRWMKSAYELDA